MKLLAIALITACGGGNSKPDAALALIDAPAPSPDAKMHVGTAKSHTLYLNFEGDSVTPGADDATMDKSSIPQAAATLAGFLVGNASRDIRLAEIVTQIKAALAPYDIDVVTTRPAAGPYDMTIVTDDPPTKIGSFAGVGAVTSTSCNSVASVIAFAFPGTGTAPAQVRNSVANNTIAMLGLNAGIPASKTAGDCMCVVDAGCGAMAGNAICAIGGATTMVDLGNSGAEACGDTDTTMDEGAKFLAAFGPH